MKEIHTYLTDDRDVIMSFRGDFTHKTVTNLLSFVKRILENTDTDYQFKKKAYAIVVEAMENITKHSVVLRKDQMTAKNRAPFFAISRHDDHFKIQTGNLIMNTQMEILKERLEEVNLLEKDELKELYAKRLQEKKPQGGGLGIIDISMRSGCKLSHEFIPCENETSFFILQTILNK